MAEDLAQMGLTPGTADCIAAETARAFGLRLATADPYLVALCREEGISVAPLPDGRGR